MRNRNALPLYYALAAVAAVVALGSLSPLHAQKPMPESKYQVAQRSIATAINNLEAFLRETPNAKEVPIARTQLNTLKSIQATAAAVIPVRLMGGVAYATADNSGTEWAVTSVARESDKTVVTLTIHNILESGTSAFFAFDRNPLAMVDNKGQFYNMLAVTSEAPAGVVKSRQGGNADNSHYLWSLQGGQTIQVTVEFEPLAATATGGKILYKDNNHSEPAVFSLLNRRQTP